MKKVTTKRFAIYFLKNWNETNPLCFIGKETGTICIDVPKIGSIRIYRKTR